MDPGRSRAHALIEPLPVPAIVTQEGRCIAVNRSYLKLIGIEESAILGRSAFELLDELVVSADRRLVESAATRVHASGHFWCRLRDTHGRELPLRVVWWEGPEEGQRLTFFFDAAPEAFGRAFADSLARAAGSLGSCATEEEVLERGCDALAARELTATVLLISKGDPLLRYGPTRSPRLIQERRFEQSRPPRVLLEALNPDFAQRRAAFFQDGIRLVRDAYPEPVREDVLRVLPSERMVQAPLFVDGEPYGALVVTGDLLTPLSAAAIELFAELIRACDSRTCGCGARRWRTNAWRRSAKRRR